MNAVGYTLPYKRGGAIYQDLYFYNFRIGTVMTIVDPEAWDEPKWLPECRLAKLLRAPADTIQDGGRLIHFYAGELFRWCHGDGGDSKNKIDTIKEAISWSGTIWFSEPGKYPVQIKYPGEEGMTLGTLVKAKGGIKFERVANRISNSIDTIFLTQTKDQTGIAENDLLARVTARVSFRELVKSDMYS